MISEPDARRLLGVGEQATVEEVRAARRRLAKAIHPDVAGGSAVAMQRINDATALLLATAAAPTGGRTSPPTFRAHWRDRPSGGFRRHVRVPIAGGPVVRDTASFVIEALPAEAFEALLVVTSWIGEVISDDPPDLLEVLLTDPLRCWCRLDLVPDAGASTVSISIARLPDATGSPGAGLPDIDAVRDLWVHSLNELGRPE